MTRWLPGGPPDPLTPELLEKALEDSYKRKRIRAYAMAALPGVIQTTQGDDVTTIARRAFRIAEEMEYQEHVRNRQ